MRDGVYREIDRSLKSRSSASAGLASTRQIG